MAPRMEVCPSLMPTKVSSDNVPEYMYTTTNISTWMENPSGLLLSVYDSDNAAHVPKDHCFETLPPPLLILTIDVEARGEADSTM